MTKLQKVFWISLFVKLAVSVVIPLTNDEAYYWVWSQNMQLSFYDHPPFVAWLFWLGDKIDFWGGMVRWPGVLLGHATLGLWLLILKPYFNEEQGFYWLLLALLSPLVGGTNLVVTPDLPLLFFYALSLFVFYEWRKNPRWWMSLALGLSVGLGMTSKYVMILFPLSLLPLILLSRQLRGPFFRQLIWIACGFAIGALPVWLWNVLNDFASIRFQAEHGLGHKIWKPSWTVEYILAQIGLVFPIILYWAIRARRQMPAVFHLLAWTPILFFLFTTSRGYVEANWPIVAYPAILALAVANLPTNIRGIQSTLALWGTVMFGLLAVVLTQPDWAKTTKFREFHQFDTLEMAAKELNPLFARSYQMAAKMHFDLKRPVFKLKGMNRRDFYDYLPQSEPGRGTYYLAVEKGDTLPIAFVSLGHKVTDVRVVDEQFEIWKIETP